MAARRTLTAVSIEARSSEYVHFLEETIDVGRHFTEAEDRRQVPVAVLGSEVAEALFPGEPSLGRSVTLGGRHFDVIGVMKSRGAILGQSQDKYVIVPFGTACQAWGRPDDKGKNREVLGAVLGAFLGCIGWIIVALLPKAGGPPNQ